MKTNVKTATVETESNGTLPMIPLNYEGSQVRVMFQSGDPWWVAKDVCDILDIQWKGSDSLGPLDEDEKCLSFIDTPGGKQNIIIVSQPGLFKLIFRSNKPVAKKFTRWVTHEVLPSIMRTGGYAVATPNAVMLQREDYERMLCAIEKTAHLIETNQMLEAKFETRISALEKAATQTGILTQLTLTDAAAPFIRQIANRVVSGITDQIERAQKRGSYSNPMTAKNAQALNHLHENLQMAESGFHEYINNVLANREQYEVIAQEMWRNFQAEKNLTVTPHQFGRWLTAFCSQNNIKLTRTSKFFSNISKVTGEKLTTGKTSKVYIFVMPSAAEVQK